MLITPPIKGTVVFEYMPINLNSYRKAYSKQIWYDSDYWRFRLTAGLLYATEQEVLERIAYEKRTFKKTKTNYG